MGWSFCAKFFKERRLKLSKNSKDGSKGQSQWLMKIFLMTFCLSVVFNYLSTEVVENLNIAVSIIILILVIVISIITDIIAIAATAAEEAPFHAKAADKKRGAKQSVMIIKNADKVSSVCADVIGDVCGVLAGATSALVALNIANLLKISAVSIVTMLVTATVTAFMVFGKGIGKRFGIKNANQIVDVIGVILSYLSFTGK